MAAGDERRVFRNVRGETTSSYEDRLRAARDRALEVVAAQEQAPILFDSPRPIGGSRDVPLIGGLDAVLTSARSAAQEVGNVAKELRILNERTISMGANAVAGVESAQQRALVDAYKEAISDQTRQMVEELRNLKPEQSGPPQPVTPPAREAAPATWLPVNGPVNPRAESPADDARQPDLDALRGGAPERPATPPGPTNQEEFDRRRNYLVRDGKLSIANLRQDLGRGMQERLENWTYGPQLAVDPLGNTRFAGPSPDEYGEIATEADIAAVARRERIAGAVRGGAAALAEGATLREAGLGMLPMAAARLAGGAGAVFAAGKAVGDLVTSQRSKNNAFISQMGGGQMDAMEERARGQLFKLSQFGTLDGADADALYRGVAETGMNREERGAAQDFAIEAYKDLGMSIDDSVRLIQFAASRGQTSLTGLAEALRGVTETAAAAGVNTEQARKVFEENWRTASDVFTGGTATGVAQGLTQAAVGMGSEYANMNLSGALSVQNLRVMAATDPSGRTDLNDILAESMDPGGDVRVLERIEQQQQEVVSEQLGPQGQRLIADAWQSRENAANGGDFTQAEKDRLSAQLLRETDMDIDVSRQVIASFGGPSDLTVQQTPGYLIDTFTGKFSPAEEGRKEEQRRQEMSQTRSFDAMALDQSAGNRVKDAVGGGWRGMVAKSVVDRFTSTPTTKEFQDLADDVEGDVGSAFLDNARETGRRGGISEVLATTKDSEGIDTVVVETDEGQREVSLEDAMRYFRDQIDAGTATVVGGEKGGSTVADALNLAGDQDLSVTSSKEGAELDGKDLSEIGKAYKEGGDGAANGTVVITPSPYLMALLEFSTGGTGITLDPDAYLEPGSAYTRPEGRSTGTPSRR